MVWLFFRASHFVWSRVIIAFVVGLVSWIIAVILVFDLASAA